MIPFILGGLLGALCVYAFYWRARQEAARLDEEKQALMEERQIVLDYMHTMVDAVGERLPREELFQRIVHAAILSTGALSACIFEKGADNLMRGVAVEGLFPPHRPIPEGLEDEPWVPRQVHRAGAEVRILSCGRGVVGRVAATGRGELITNAAADPRIVKHEDDALTVRSVIAAPITVRQRLIGVLCVCNASDGRPFTGTDYSLVEALAEQAGLAVHNADFLALLVDKQRLDLDLALASDVQQMLLPRTMPAVPGLDIDARYLAAQKVSGDLYDVFRLGFDRIGVAVADVSGKGVSASLLMAICRTTLRQIAPLHSSPARVLAELNRTLAGDMREGMYITMTYAVVDAGKNQITAARAGHELSLLSRRDASTGAFLSEFIGSEGLPVGLVEAEFFDAAIEDKTLAFPIGSTLVLYTDGLTEAPNVDSKEFGGARLADALRAAHAGSAREINDSILAAVGNFSGLTDLRDDYTLLTVKRV
jgi:sigma-B regulation protein RsbU (phosphoserine phosphatase)